MDWEAIKKTATTAAFPAIAVNQALAASLPAVADAAIATVKGYLGAHLECLAAADKARIDVMNSTFATADSVARNLAKEFSPLLDPLFAALGTSIERDPKPWIIIPGSPNHFYFGPYTANTCPSAWFGFSLDDFKGHLQSMRRYSHLSFFVHGMNYSGRLPDCEQSGRYPGDTVDDYGAIEHGAGLDTALAGGAVDYCNCMVFWDSLLSDEDASKILRAIAGLGDLAAPFSQMLLWSVYFREVIRRARIVGEFLEPYIRAVADADRIFCHAITHSAGNAVWLEAMRIALRTGLPQQYIFGTWWSMQAALPRDVFTRNEYSSVANYYDRFGRLVVWHSYTDYVLNTMYPYAMQTSALGVFGANNSLVTDVNVTELAREAHGQESRAPNTPGYFDRIASEMRRRQNSFLVWA